VKLIQVLALSVPARSYSLISRLLVVAWLGTAVAHASAAGEPESQINRAEELAWSDPRQALSELDRIRPAAADDDAAIEFLTVRGMALARDHDAKAARDIVAQLHALGSRVPAAEAASHFVRATLLFEESKTVRAAAELRLIGAESALSERQRFRIEALRGNIFRSLGQYGSAVQAYERALDLADLLQCEPRGAYTRSNLAYLYLITGNLDLAAKQLQIAQTLAERAGDDIALVRLSENEADLAQRRGDEAGDLRATQQELDHARKSGVNDLMVMALADLGDTYQHRGQYALALDYSRKALALEPGVQDPIVSFNIGIAEIGLGRLSRGKRDVNRVLDPMLARGDSSDAPDMIQEYIAALERAGDWRAADLAHRRNDQLREKLFTNERERALLELSAKFDDERRARQIELLRRDNEIKSRDLQVAVMRKRLTAAAALLIAVICGVLGWSIRRVRSANRRLRHNSEHDALTGLRNRRYFQEHLLASEGNRRFAGSVLLIDLDHFKRINDNFGHPAGDAVLAAVAKRLANTLRGEDTLVRWGGEEFLIVLGEMHESQLQFMAHRLLDAVRGEPIAHNERQIRCTASIGCARFPMPGAAVDVSLERAISLVDKALYQAKRRGRDRACLITLVEINTEQDWMSITDDLEIAAAQHRLELLEAGSTTGTHRALAG
jgi:diguanylate cyclase (GGDEF)-like protein